MALVPTISNEQWIEWAHPVWYHNKESRTLTLLKGARTSKDERQVCSLQLDTTERSIRLWNNPGERLLSPFTGIDSEGDEALRPGRTFTGIELKPFSFHTAHKNLERVLRDKTQASLWEEATALEEDVLHG